MSEYCYCHIFSILKLTLSDFVFKLSLFSEVTGRYFLIFFFFGRGRLNPEKEGCDATSTSEK